MFHVVSWVVFVIGLVIFLKTYFVYNKRLQEGQKQIEQVQSFCNQFMTTVIQLMDELEEKKKHFDQVWGDTQNSNNSYLEQSDNIVQINQDVIEQAGSYSSKDDLGLNKVALYQQATRMMEEGKGLDFIAKQLDIGVGELKLIISLSSKNSKFN